MNLVFSAAQFASEAHGKQKRKYGSDPYIWHPMRVAGRVTLFGGATEHWVAAAWLHDVLEDTKTRPFELEMLFGPAITKLVSDLTDPSHGLDLPRAERKKMQREWLARATPVARRIKLADRIDNLWELRRQDAPADWKALYCEESLLLAEAIGDVDYEQKDELMDLVKSMK